MTGVIALLLLTGVDATPQCSVQDGSSKSEAYPCNCGSASCWCKLCNLESLTDNVCEAGEEQRDWYCAVRLYPTKILKKTTSLGEAQQALNSITGGHGNDRAVIPMTSDQSGNCAGDPHHLDKEWEGGSAWWGSWDPIHRMRDACKSESPPTEIAGGQSAASEAVPFTVAAALLYILS